MFEKFIITIMITVFLIGTLSGCSSISAANNNQIVTPQKGADTLEGLDKNVIQDKGKDRSEVSDDFSAEVKHWKYGVKNSAAPTPAALAASSVPTSPIAKGSNGDWSQAVSIELLSADDMDNIMNQLVAQGYLTKKTRIESEFKQALSAYQSDHNLQITGKLDKETLSSLNKGSESGGQQ